MYWNPRIEAIKCASPIAAQKQWHKMRIVWRRKHFFLLRRAWRKKDKKRNKKMSRKMESGVGNRPVSLSCCLPYNGAYPGWSLLRFATVNWKATGKTISEIVRSPERGPQKQDQDLNGGFVLLSFLCPRQHGKYPKNTGITRKQGMRREKTTGRSNSEENKHATHAAKRAFRGAAHTLKKTLCSKPQNRLV